jgi:hypothetical protein
MCVEPVPTCSCKALNQWQQQCSCWVGYIGVMMHVASYIPISNIVVIMLRHHLSGAVVMVIDDDIMMTVDDIMMTVDDIMMT